MAGQGVKIFLDESLELSSLPPILPSFLYRGGWGMRPPLYSSLHFHHHIHIVPPLIETLEGSRPTSTPPHYTLSISILGVQASECPYHFHHRFFLFRSSMGEKPTSLRTLPIRLPHRHRWVLRLLGFSISPPLTSATASIDQFSTIFGVRKVKSPYSVQYRTRSSSQRDTSKGTASGKKRVHPPEISKESGLTASGLRSRQ